MEELEAFRRKQLRSVIGVQWPRKVSNADLYERCGVRELEHTIRGARWREFGHIMRKADDNPAKYATKQYFNANRNAWRGRPRTTIGTVLNNDLNRARLQHNIVQSPLWNLPAQLKTNADLNIIEELAANRDLWQSIVANMQCLTPSQPQRLMPPRNAKN